MRIIVASANIFRRELTSYLLHEAGYLVSEDSSLEGLTASLGGAAPAAVVADTHLVRAEPGGAVRGIRLCTAAPLLWIGDAACGRSLVLADSFPADVIPWPYNAEDLRGRLRLLLHHASAPLTVEPPRARAVGAAE